VDALVQIQKTDQPSLGINNVLGNMEFLVELLKDDKG
jgi:hypothetical protein